MSTLLDNVPVQPNQYPNFAYPENDEIDLKELFIALWQGKWIILISTLIFSALAVVYALTSQEWCTVRACYLRTFLSNFGIKFLEID
ncbi:Wzz/FepE/Etk N-terminal domain-containing protein [Vibrio metschnikovii]|uniref:Wzz/FepE/Etk N-terminal domain-containing protein n=1 Tax=Vibrio metschnikovii TaxID=28172 RepID=UPI001C2FB622|nr:Wzz/FepE/Etk N-terminal domain-containing protein [Vibrio metschnikovii]